MADRTRWLRGLLALAAVVAVCWAFVAALGDAREVPLPSVGALLFSGLSLSAGLLAAAAAWASLLRGHRYAQVLPGFAVAQLAKYVPGSIWQGVGQVADAHRLGVGMGTATLAFFIQICVQVLVTGATSAVALLTPGLPIWLAALSAMGPLGLALIHPASLRALVRGLARVSRRVSPAALDIPEWPVLLRAAIASFAAAAALGVGFAVLLAGSGDLRQFIGTAGVFLLAWTIGFLIIPVPAGLGIREAVLVVGLSGLHSPAEVLAASIICRLVLIVSESTIAGVAQFGRILEARS